MSHMPFQKISHQKSIMSFKAAAFMDFSMISEIAFGLFQEQLDDGNEAVGFDVGNI